EQAQPRTMWRWRRLDLPRRAVVFLGQGHLGAVGVDGLPDQCAVRCGCARHVDRERLLRTCRRGDRLQRPAVSVPLLGETRKTTGGAQGVVTDRLASRGPGALDPTKL